jgi:hypothetical protein
MAAEDNAKEDLELNDETADQVRGGTPSGKPPEAIKPGSLGISGGGMGQTGSA